MIKKNSLKHRVKGNFFCSALFVLLFFSGCHSVGKQENNEKGKIRILSTTAMIGDLVNEIGKDHVSNTTLIRGELDPHSYELVKGDDEKFARADIIFSNGLGLEHGYSLRHNLENNSKNVFLGNALLIEHPDTIVTIDRQHDPHIWMDISLWMKIVDPIAHHLSKIDPLHASDYQKNAASLKEKMQKADEMTYEKLQEIPSEYRFLVTSHNAFNYFVKRYLCTSSEKQWSHRLAAPEGLSPESELSVCDLMRVTDYIKEHKVFVLFAESNVNQEALKKIICCANEKGMMLRISKKSLYVDSMGDNKSYLDMMNYNVETIIEEIKR